MKKLLAKKVSDLLNSTVKASNTAEEIEPFKWFTGTIEVPKGKKQDK
jgi:hypothetical protein